MPGGGRLADLDPLKSPYLDHQAEFHFHGPESPMEQLVFPRYADDAQRLLIWTPEQLGPAAIMFVVGILSGALFTCVLLGLVFSWAYTKYSAGKPNRFVLHWAYWHGLVPLKSRAAINPFLRRILPL